MLSVERAYEDEEPSVWCMIIARRKMFGGKGKRVWGPFLKIAVRNFFVAMR